MGDQEQNENGPKRLRFYVTLISSILGLFLLVGGVVLSMESRYATASSVEKQIQMTTGNLLETIQQDRKNSAIRFYQEMLDQSHDKVTELLQILQHRPNDEFLKRRIELEQQKQQKYKDKLDTLLGS